MAEFILTQLATLESSGLIRLADVEPDLAYLFRHALIQDAAYESVLRADRRKLHLAVGEVLERLFADHLDEIAPLLGQHFEEAGDDLRAVRYYQQAGDNAAQRFASPEAVTHYSNAINVASRTANPAPGLHRARGLAYETLGQFDLARADHEQALALAQGDQLTEWQALIDLGALWAERDYARTGDYFQRAYALAQTLDDPLIKAHTLNRLGNWHLNIEQPGEARHYQEQALAIFETLHDQRGLAETSDLLGMTNFLSCDLVRAHHYFTRAIPLFEALGDRQGLASSLASLGASGPNFQVDTMVAVQDLQEARHRAEASLALTQTIGQRSGEAYAWFSLAHCTIGQGRFDDGYQAANSGITVARSIGHLQWLTAGQLCLGLWHREVGDLATARQVLEQGLSWAKESGSLHWLRCMAGVLGDVYIAQGEFELAEQVLGPVSDAEAAILTLAHRLVWHALADLALARGEVAEALRLADWLEASAPHVTSGGHTILRLVNLRAEIYLSLGRLTEAEALVQKALPVAEIQQARLNHIRLYRLLAKICQAQQQIAQAEAASQRAQTIVAQLAAGISDPKIRQMFIDSRRQVIKE